MMGVKVKYILSHQTMHSYEQKVTTNKNKRYWMPISERKKESKDLKRCLYSSVLIMTKPEEETVKRMLASKYEILLSVFTIIMSRTRTILTSKENLCMHFSFSRAHTLQT